MKTLNLRETGPFSPKEAAERVKLASKQLKWFTPCQPQWDTAHFVLDWPTIFPLPALPAPKELKIAKIDHIHGDFMLSKTGTELVKAAESAAGKLKGIAGFWFSAMGYGWWNKPGLRDLSIMLTEREDWQITASVYHQEVQGNEETLTAAKTAGFLAGITGWSLDKREGREGHVHKGFQETNLILTLSQQSTKSLPDVLGIILSSQSKPIKKGFWSVYFKYNTLWSVDGENWKQDSQQVPEWDKQWWQGGRKTEWKPFGGTSHLFNGTHQDFFKLVNSVNFPNSKAEVQFWCTLERLDHYEAMFELAQRCKPSIRGPVGIFETESGKQGFMLFDSSKKGIKLWVMYGRNGWEELHEALRRNNGDLTKTKNGYYRDNLAKSSGI